jgi:hypothetical protein
MTLPVPHAPTVPGPADAVRPVGSDSGFAAGRVADTAETAPMRSYERLPVTGLYSIAHLLPKSKRRCGIYVLSFRNGDRYVGQALDVAVRFAAHRRTYPDDIVDVAFRRVPCSQLDAMERAEISRLHKAGIPLRNVVHARAGSTRVTSTCSSPPSSSSGGSPRPARRVPPSTPARISRSYGIATRRGSTDSPPTPGSPT